MSPHYRQALLAMESQLILNVKVATSLQTHMHTDAGGFMDDTEYYLVMDEKPGHERMLSLLKILLRKGDNEYNIFLAMLRASGLGDLAQAVQDKAEEFSRTPSTPVAGLQESASERGQLPASALDRETLDQMFRRLSIMQQQLESKCKAVRQLQSDYDVQQREAQLRPQGEQQIGAAGVEILKRITVQQEENATLYAQMFALQERTVELLTENRALLRQRAAQREQQLADKDQRIMQLERQLAEAVSAARAATHSGSRQS